jgi:hypothetical protein
VLRRLSSIRNLFAHCGVTRYKAETKESYVPDPRKPEEGLDFAALHEEFLSAIPSLRDYLLARAVEKGAEIKINKDGTWEEVRA